MPWFRPDRNEARSARPCSTTHGYKRSRRASESVYVSASQRQQTVYGKRDRKSMKKRYLRIAAAAGLAAACMAAAGCSAAPQAAGLNSVQAVATREAAQSTPVHSERQWTAGEVRQLAEELPEAFPPEHEPTCSSSVAETASVDEPGVLPAVTPEQATVSAQSEDSRWIVEIEPAPEKPGVQISANYLSLTPGTTGSLSAIVTGDVPGAQIWTSSDETVATVGPGGTVSGIGNGVCRISVRVGDYDDSVGVWVTDAPQDTPPAASAAPRYARGEDGVLRRAAEPTGEAVILLTGDIMALSAQQNAARSGGSSWDYNSSFCLVQPIFAEADFVMGNLETCLSRSNPTAAQARTVQNNPNCNAQASFADALRYAGYDAVATANNHSGDTGIMGLYETIQVLDSRGIAHTGTFSRAGEQRFVLADINGIPVAFLSATELLNTKQGNLAMPEDYEDIILNRFSEQTMRENIAAAREAGAAYVVVFEHWGTENTHAYTEQQMRHAQQIADAGADFIAGSHSHCLQPPVLLTAADGRQVPCIFSTGNFVSSMAKDINNDTVILRLELGREGDGIVLRSAGYIPCHVFAEYSGGHHVIVPVPPELNGGSSTSSLDAAERRITGVLGTDVLTELAGPA